MAFLGGSITVRCPQCGDEVQFNINVHSVERDTTVVRVNLVAAEMALPHSCKTA